MSKSKLRPGAINSQGLRTAFGHRANDPLYSRLFGVAEEMKMAFDGLVAVREAQTPLKTREANAVELRQKTKRTTEIVKRKMETVAREFIAAVETKKGQALERAGVRDDPPGADEVRRAFREMGSGAAGDRARTAALDAAAKRGDRVVLAAIRNAPSPITVGGFNVPTDQVIEAFVRQENPGYEEELDELLTAMEHMNILEESFEMGADKLRDRVAEEAADKGIRLAEEADRKLRGALGVDPAPAA